MKKLIAIVLIMSFFSCKNQFEVISSIKQRVIPGVQTVKPYTNYMFKVEVKPDIELELERILVIEDSECYQPRFSIKKKGTASSIESIKESGVYAIKASIEEGKYTKVENCTIDKNKVILFYTVNGKSENLEIDSFIEEHKRRR